MKLGEIMLESLRLMNANDESLNITKINEYKSDDSYKDYLDRMPGAINRAISRFATFKVIPTKTVELSSKDAETLKGFLKFDLNALIDDFNSLERVMFIDKKVVPIVDYQSITNGVVLIPYNSNNENSGVFTFEYTPNIETITAVSDVEMVLPLPKQLATIIPYFVKADLYEQDEPQISATARNIFESALTEYISYGMPRKQRQSYVKNVMY